MTHRGHARGQTLCECTILIGSARLTGTERIRGVYTLPFEPKPPVDRTRISVITRIVLDHPHIRLSLLGHVILSPNDDCE